MVGTAFTAIVTAITQGLITPLVGMIVSKDFTDMTFTINDSTFQYGTVIDALIRFLSVADEEAGSAFGVEWLDREHPDVLDAAFAINEGGYGAESYLGSERPLFGVSMAEKSPLWLTLRATGKPGHGSAPHEDNVLDRMVRAMQRVQAWQRPYLLTPPVADALRAAGRNALAHAQGVVMASVGVLWLATGIGIALAGRRSRRDESRPPAV